MEEVPVRKVKKIKKVAKVGADGEKKKTGIKKKKKVVKGVTTSEATTKLKPSTATKKSATKKTTKKKTTSDKATSPSISLGTSPVSKLKLKKPLSLNTSTSDLLQAMSLPPTPKSSVKKVLTFKKEKSASSPSTPIVARALPTATVRKLPGSSERKVIVKKSSLVAISTAPPEEPSLRERFKKILEDAGEDIELLLGFKKDLETQLQDKGYNVERDPEQKSLLAEELVRALQQHEQSEQSDAQPEESDQSESEEEEHNKKPVLTLDVSEIKDVEDDTDDLTDSEEEETEEEEEDEITQPFVTENGEGSTYEEDEEESEDSECESETPETEAKEEVLESPKVPPIQIVHPEPEEHDVEIVEANENTVPANTEIQHSYKEAWSIHSDLVVPMIQLTPPTPNSNRRVDPFENGQRKEEPISPKELENLEEDSKLAEPSVESPPVLPNAPETPKPIQLDSPKSAQESPKSENNTSYEVVVAENINHTQESDPASVNSINIKSLSATDKAALRAKALERITQIKERLKSG